MICMSMTLNLFWIRGAIFTNAKLTWNPRPWTCNSWFSLVLSVENNYISYFWVKIRLGASLNSITYNNHSKYDDTRGFVDLICSHVYNNLVYIPKNKNHTRKPDLVFLPSKCNKGMILWNCPQKEFWNKHKSCNITVRASVVSAPIQEWISQRVQTSVISS